MTRCKSDVVLGVCSEAFVEGLATLFATYYNFSLAYLNEAACKLEFIEVSHVFFSFFIFLTLFMQIFVLNSKVTVNIWTPASHVHQIHPTQKWLILP